MSLSKPEPGEPFTVRRAEGGDRQAWDAFVDEAEAGNLSHLFGWSRVLRRAYGKRSFNLVAEGESGVEAVLPLIQMRGLGLGSNRLVSMPFLDQGGPLAISEAASKAVIEASLRLAAELGAETVEFRGACSGMSGAPTQTERYRLLLPLPDTQEALLTKVGPKVRNQIRKSEKSGLVTEPVAASELSSFYSIFARNMRDLGSPVHSKKLFAEILDEFSSRAQLYLTRTTDGHPVAGAIALRFKAALTVPWASSLLSARPQCPNHSLYARILTDAVERGLDQFDFGRSSTGTGTFHFKKQWRAEAEPLFWCSFDQSGEVRSETYLSSRGNPRLARAWSRLPVSVTNLVGPVIRSRIAN